MKITVLGCGSSMGTPNAGGFWGECDPKEKKNERTRASILVQSATTNLLVDTSYDLRAQLNRVPLKNVDGVLISHAHNDHVNGIDDLRAISYHSQRLIDVYGNEETLDEIDRRWPFIFKPGAEGIYVEFLKKNIISDYQKFCIGDIDIQSFEQDHMTCKSLGFRFGNFAYSVDVADLDEKSLSVLEGLDVWMVDAGSYHREEILTHANLKRVLGWVERLKPKMTYLTVLTSRMDYKILCEELPPHIRPAYDGMEIDLQSNQR